MNLSIKSLLNVFPEEVIVTDQIIDISGFSNIWKNNVVQLTMQILKEFKKNNTERYIVAIAGASGSSKSTTAKVLENILNKVQDDVQVLTVGQDAYHHYQKYLLENIDNSGRLLASHKGRYDTFDVVNMKKDIESFVKGEKNISFPEYSRKIHNPISNAIYLLNKPTILIFEGLWLFYDKKPWNELLPFYNLKVFLHAPADFRKKNTIIRHIRGNEHTPKKAEIFYQESDVKNSDLILKNISKHDLDFYLN